MQKDQLYMRRCLELAQKGLGSVSTNPMVGAVVVHEDRIIGEGYHQKFGEAHAEVNAINSVKDDSLLPESTVYVNLEPCSHYGKTPPCADLLVEKKVKRLVIGMMDPFKEVSGRGIKRLQDAGIEAAVGVLEEECRELNKRFITYNIKKRPYIILKWAQSTDGKIGSGTAERWMISGKESQLLSHKWRTEEDAILVGANTALQDNPSLTARLWPGRNPKRILLDRSGRVKGDLNLFSGEAETFVFSAKEAGAVKNIRHIKVNEDLFLESAIFKLAELNIQSVIVEGGAQIHQALIQCGLWDEIRIIESNKILGKGVRAASIPQGKITFDSGIGEDRLVIVEALNR